VLILCFWIRVSVKARVELDLGLVLVLRLL
jgi:hypothetical protein